MHISYRWLQRHIDLGPLAGEPEITAPDVASLLNLSTAEVEGVERFAPVLSDVVVGHVLERAKHPDADKLSVCRVEVGGDSRPSEVLQIVCGASNVAGGQRVAVARAGTRLPGDVHIKRSKIRGVESDGMICSERELALGEEHNGIWVLPGEPTVGRPVAEALACEDWVLTIDNKSLTHRPDLWGHRGIAGELAAITGRPLKPLAPALPEPAAAVVAGSMPGAALALRIESEACARYLALTVGGLHNGPSPLWLRLLLLAAGQRPLDLLVDLSNFVMLDLGQPNHAFDRRAIRAGIEVRNARPGERLTTLDGVERELVPDDLLICDGARPLALAGIMGGASAKVAPDTSEIVLEVASFHYATVRRTAQRLALRTDASSRFEKQLSPTLVPLAAAHFCALLFELQPGAALTGAPIEAGNWKDPARSLLLRPGRVRAVLGSEISDPEIERILAGLSLAVERQAAGDAWRVAIPSVRSTKDLTSEEDLIEEVGRIHRYDRIPEHKLVAALEPPPRDERRRLVRVAEDRLAGAAAFRQALTHSFLSDELAERLGIAGEPALEVANPIAAGLARLRRSVAPNLIGLLPANLKQRAEVRLFEVGKGYLPEERSARGEPREVHEIALVLGIAAGSTVHSGPGTSPDFAAGALARLEATVIDLLAHLGRPASRLVRASEALADAVPGGHRGLPPWMHPLRSIALCAASDGAPLAIVGDLDPIAARRLDLSADAAAAIVSLDRLLAVPQEPPRYRPLAAFPAVKLDVALLLPAETPAAAALAAIERAAKGLCGASELFDVFQGERLGAGKKSLAFHVELAATDRTLGEKDVQKFLERLAREAGLLCGELRRE